MATKFKTHNSFSVEGRLADRPDIRYSQTEGGFISFTLIVSEETWNPDTRKFEVAKSRLPLSFYSKNPEEDIVGLNKGVAVIVDGHLRGRSYNSNGESKLTADIRVDNIDIIEPMLSQGQPQAQGQGVKTQASAQAPKRKSVEPPPYNGPDTTVEQFDDDPIPF